MKVKTLTEGEADENSYDTYLEFVSELEQAIDAGQFQIVEPQSPGKVTFTKAGQPQIKGRRRHFIFRGLACGGLDVVCFVIHKSEWDGFAAICVGNPLRATLMFWFIVPDDMDPDGVDADVINKGMAVESVQDAVYHEFVHYLQKFNGFENIARNLIMCVTPYKQLTWEIETHTAEFHRKFLAAVDGASDKEGAMRAVGKLGMTPDMVASQQKFVDAVMAGHFQNVDRNFHEIVKANAKSRQRSFLVRMVSKAHNMIVGRISAKSGQLAAAAR